MSCSPPRRNPGHYPALDGLRGFAAFAICLLHLAHSGHLRLSSSLDKAFLAVDFFFILSGVVIADRYEARLLSGSFLRLFVLRRAVRLYPVALAGTLLGAFAFALARWFNTGPTPRLGELAFAAIWNATLLPLPYKAQWSSSLWPIDPPFWSLFFEILVNIAYALSIAHLRGWRMLLPVTVALLVLVFHCGLTGSLEHAFVGSGLIFGLARAVLGFGIGVIIARLNFARRLPAIRISGWSGIVALVLVLWAPFHPLFGAAYDLAAIVLAMPLIVIAVMRAEPEPLSARLFGLAGLVSYPLYAVHEDLFHVVRSVLIRTHHAQIIAREDTVLILFPLAVIISYLLARLYDGPVRARLSHALAGKTAFPAS